MNSTALTQIRVPFYGAELMVIGHGGQPYTPMKPIVMGMGMSWQGQHEKLRTNEGRWGIKEILIPSHGGEQQTICLPLRKLPGWLMTIHPNKLRPELRERVLTYQNECDDVLWAHWSQQQTMGEYTVNPDLEYDQMRSYSKDRKQMEALNTAHSRWISDVRQALESAGIKEPEFPKGLEDSKAIATSALVELLRWHRWVLDFGPDFRLRLTPVTLHTNFLTSEEVADWVRHPTFPSKHLPDIAKATIERMSKAFSEKAIGPHMEQAAQKGMGNASRHTQ
ncbi:phage antirepressor N-terminal domain-containing protein [Xylella fastidiosa subsp. sandyi]